MLIEFTAANFRSIKNDARLSLVASSAKERKETNVMTPETSGGARAVSLVRSAAIYGPNAAGKTNLLRALAVMQNMVARPSTEIGTLPVTPFLFDPDFEAQPTTLETVFLMDGVRYQYGFSATSSGVTAEWLYAWPRGKVQLWFERNAETGEDRFKFGDKLLGDKRVWQRATRPDALFLATAASLNSRQLSPVRDWFADRLRVVGIGGWDNTFSLDCCGDDRKSRIIELLQRADLAICDVRVTEQEISPEMIAQHMPMALIDAMAPRLAGIKMKDLRVGHEVADGQRVELDLEVESDGTQKLFALAGPWVDTLEKGRVVVFDELHDNLHPALVRFLVELFHDPKANANGAQLIFSTHDTSILSQSVFRRDQIWFCQRNERQETELFPLTDFRPRKGIENLERSYLAGRYGALPYVRATQVAE